jgi:hypothetical protein
MPSAPCSKRDGDPHSELARTENKTFADISKTNYSKMTTLSQNAATIQYRVILLLQVTSHLSEGDMHRASKVRQDVYTFQWLKMKQLQ